MCKVLCIPTVSTFTNQGYKTIRPQKGDQNLKEETTLIISVLNHSLWYSQRKYCDEYAEKMIKFLCNEPCVNCPTVH